MDRKLASVQKIIDIQSIKDADKIEVATVLGWQVVVAKKDNFKIGDNAVYIEIDSIVPEKPEFEFLRDRKFRVRTIKLRGQISQGLLLPMSILPKANYKEGQDVTEILGIKKYDTQAEIEQRLLDEKIARENSKIKKFLMKMKWYRRIFPKKKHGFPSFIKITDEDRIQLFPDICTKESETPFIVTEKIDGQSATYFLIKHKGIFKSKYTFGVCSRKVFLPKKDNSSYWTIAIRHNIEGVLKSIIGNNNYVVLQGEIIGNRIQGNKYGVNGYDFYAFNLIYPDKKVDSIVAKEILSEHNIKFVPIIEENFLLKSTIPEMVDFSNSKSMIANTLREGIVLRNYEKNISFKVVSPEFLLKYGE